MPFDNSDILFISYVQSITVFFKFWFNQSLFIQNYVVINFILFVSIVDSVIQNELFLYIYTKLFRRFLLCHILTNFQQKIFYVIVSLFEISHFRTNILDSFRYLLFHQSISLAQLSLFSSVYIMGPLF